MSWEEAGEAWGYLRIFPADVNLLRPTDIPVFDDLPLDLSVVAGTITKAYQDINSHVNLKAKERNTPNMVLRENVQRRIQRLQETDRWASPQRDYTVTQTFRAGTLSGLPAFALGVGLTVRPSLTAGAGIPAPRAGVQRDRATRRSYSARTRSRRSR